MATANRGRQGGQGRGRKSGGPKSAAGKEASSLNSTKHGILSSRLILKEEKMADFDQLFNDLCGSLKPVGAFEQFLVERIAVSIWRQRRLIRAETIQIEQQLADARARQCQLWIDMLQWNSAQMVADGRVSVVKDLFSKFQKEHEAIKEEMTAFAIEDWELLADKAPMLYDFIQVEAEKAGQPVMDYLSANFATLSEWAEAKLSQYSQSLKALEGLADQQQAENTESKDKMIQDGKNSVNDVPDTIWIPANVTVFSRYQTMLDNDVYRAMKALWNAQEMRRAAEEYSGPGNTVDEQ